MSTHPATPPSSIDLLKPPLETSDHIPLQIRHAIPPPEETKGPVVLIHGASASFDTFLVGGERSLYHRLHSTGFDVWFLDWRGSQRVSKDLLEGPNASKYAPLFTIDRVADIDLPEALRRISGEVKRAPLKIFAHCLGSGALAQSIAAGKLDDVPIRAIVFSTLGLFYEVTFDNALKAKDFLLERMRDQGCCFVTPHEEWRGIFKDAYDVWISTLKPACKPRKDHDFCHRLCFMYGIPYLHEQLPEEVHAEETLRKQFGPIPIEMYIQAGQNVRRRWAARYSTRNPGEFLADEAREHFAGKHVTLLTGMRNTLWHRDSIDRMYEWLRRGGVLRGPETPSNGSARGSVEKVVLDEFGHQDLLWGRGTSVDRIVEVLEKER